MDRSVPPFERSLRLYFEGSECLYRDHLGRRVVLDVEGSGQYTIPEGPSVEVEIDEELTLAREGRFARSALVTMREDGPVAACAELDAFDPVLRAEKVDTFSIDDMEALKQRQWKVQNISAITMLESRPVASHLNRASWTIPIPAENRGLVLQKHYDRFHGRQRARVLIDGQFSGWWYESGQDREDRWGASQFYVRPEFTQSRDRVEIAIDPPGGSPLWSVSSYDVFALLAPNP